VRARGSGGIVEGARAEHAPEAGCVVRRLHLRDDGHRRWITHLEVGEQRSARLVGEIRGATVAIHAADGLALRVEGETRVVGEVLERRRVAQAGDSSFVPPSGTARSSDPEKARAAS
jgi:hypothetical protein